MKNNLVIVCTAAAALSVLACVNPDKPVPSMDKDQKNPVVYEDFTYQYSIMDALLAGVFDGNLSVKELKTKGDFGVGAFNTLDGELIMLDGKIYRMRFNGEVKEASDSDGTPLAVVKFFKADTSFTITGKNITYAQVREKLRSVLNKNEGYAIKFTGNFASMDGRSVAPTNKPYPQLSTYIADGGQTAFKFDNTTGTCVGFFLPGYMARTNIPGFHIHYINDDRNHGGHIFEFSSDSLHVEIDHIKGYIMETNTSNDFGTADLERDRHEELKKVE